MNVLLHADGGSGVGLGHIARCAALAGALSRAGHRAAMALDPDMLAEHPPHTLPGCRHVSVIACPREMSAVRKAARSLGADIAVIDSYRWSSDDLGSLAADVVTAAFDDEATRDLPVDAIINGAPTAERLAYRTLPRTERWFGAPFQVVREDFEDVPVRGRAGPVRSIVVLAGGTDPLRLTEEIAAPLDACVSMWAETCAVALVIGPFAPEPRTGTLYSSVMLRQPSDLPLRMQQADLAITASGQTLYELARCGTPAVALCIGSDQQYNLRAMEEAGAIVSAGWIREGDEAATTWVPAVIDAVRRLAADDEARTRMSASGQRLIDGRGAERLVVKLEQLVEQRAGG